MQKDRGLQAYFDHLDSPEFGSSLRYTMFFDLNLPLIQHLIFGNSLHLQKHLLKKHIKKCLKSPSKNKGETTGVKIEKVSFPCKKRKNRSLFWLVFQSNIFFLESFVEKINFRKGAKFFQKHKKHRARLALLHHKDYRHKIFSLNP